MLSQSKATGEPGVTRARLRGAAFVLFGAAGAGRGRGLVVLVGWLLGGGGVGIGIRGEDWAAVGPGDLVCVYGCDGHGGWLIDCYVT